jgi:hypothetical protein
VKGLVHGLGGYDGAGKFYDAQGTIKVTTGASVASAHSTASG